MRKLVVVLLATVASAGVAQADLIDIWTDNFDGYANQAAMDAVYTQLYPSYPALLDTGKGYSDGQSVHFGTPTANSQRRMYKNLGGEWDGTDEFPLKVEFMIDLDTLIWSTRQYIELRAYAGAGYADGALEQLIALGCVSSGVPDTSKYAGRVVSGPNAGWFSMNTAKSTDWTKLAIVVKTSTIEFWVNDVVDTVKNDNPGRTYDSIVIGSGLSSAGADVWFDDLKVSILPEPLTAAFLVVGGLFLRRRRA